MTLCYQNKSMIYEFSIVLPNSVTTHVQGLRSHSMAQKYLTIVGPIVATLQLEIEDARTGLQISPCIALQHSIKDLDESLSTSISSTHHMTSVPKWKLHSRFGLFSRQARRLEQRPNKVRVHRP